MKPPSDPPDTTDGPSDDDRTRIDADSQPRGFDALGPTVLEPGPDLPPLPDSAPPTEFGAQADGQKTEILSDPADVSWADHGDTLDDPTIPPSGVAASTGRGLRSSKLDRGSARLAEGSTYAGKFELLHEIARGGMGAVYKARQIDLNRIVALKVMLAGSMANDEERGRFMREAEAAGRLKHPNIVPVYDIGEVQGNLYFTQEFVDGAPLSKRKGELTRDQVLEVMIQVCNGVAYAHQRGIIHRDLKPDNIMLGADRVPKIMDFGLAKQVEVVDSKGQPTLVTREGSVMGTPHYMPPEQAEGLISEIDIRSDVWALGVILYELLTGELPFKGRSLSELMLRIFEDDPRPLRQLDATIDPDLEAIVLKALEKPQDKRYQTAADMSRDLVRQGEGLTVSARRATPLYRVRKWVRRHRRGVVLTALCLIVIGVSGGVAWRSHVAAERAGALEKEQRFAALQAQTAALTQDASASERAADALGAASNDVAARAAQAPPLSARFTALRARLADLRSDLAEHRTRAGAAEVQAALDGLDLVLTPRAAALSRLVRVHEALTAASAGAQRAEAACQAAIKALAPQRSTKQDARGLKEEVEASEALLRQSRGSDRKPDATRFGPSFEAAERTFVSALTAAQTDAFAALRDSEAGSPESAAATALLARLGRARARLAARRQGVLGVQIAFAMADAATRLLNVLDQGQPDQQLRLRGARLAQNLVQRGLEANKDDPAFPALRRRANASYARALLDMGAFPVLSGLLKEKTFDLQDDAREALVAEQARKIQGKRLLREKLDALLVGLRRASIAALTRRHADLTQLTQETRFYDDLERARRQGLVEVEAARRERARQDVSDALSAARKAEVLSVSEQFRQLDALVEAWKRADASVRGGKRWLEPSVYREAGARCALGLASVRKNAALGCGDANTKLALALARRATRGYSRIANWSQTPAPLLAQAKAKLAEAQSLVARLERVLSSAKRRAKAPPGMILIAGSGGLEVSLGDGSTRNPHRKLAIAPFYLAVREVTCREFQEFTTSPAFNDATFWRKLSLDKAKGTPPLNWRGLQCPEGQEDLSVVGIGVDEARGYAAFRGQRLPTDAEWEFAARFGASPSGGRGRDWPWGSGENPLARVLRAPGSNARDRTPEGVFDLGGNVSEWVTLPSGTAARGASYLYPFARIARGDHRLTPSSGYRGPQLGLRLAKDAVQ